MNPPATSALLQACSRFHPALVHCRQPDACSPSQLSRSLGWKAFTGLLPDTLAAWIPNYGTTSKE